MSKRIFLSITPIIVIVMLSLTGCGFRKPITIGFVTDLSSRNSQLGLQGRSGVEMAVEELNAAGGLRGRRVELIFKDHSGDKEVCIQVVDELIEADVDVVIGPLVSGMVASVLTAQGEDEVLVISPTASTDAVTGLDDYFLRLVSSSAIQGNKLAEMVKRNGQERIAIVLDERNYAYSGTVADALEKSFAGTTCEVIGRLSFDDKEDFDGIIEELSGLNSDAMVFLATGIDTAAIIQQYAKKYPLPQLYGSSWVRASNVHEYGGRVIDGMIIIDSFDAEIKSQREIEFLHSFQNRFGITPSTPGINSYDAVMLYAQGVEAARSRNAKKVKDAILGIESFPGVLTSFRLDEFGDAIRQYTFFVMKEGEYILYD